MLLRAILPTGAMLALLRLVRLHDCDAEPVAPGLLLVTGERIGPFLTDALLDERVEPVTLAAVDA